MGYDFADQLELRKKSRLLFKDYFFVLPDFYLNFCYFMTLWNNEIEYRDNCTSTVT